MLWSLLHRQYVAAPYAQPEQSVKQQVNRSAGIAVLKAGYPALTGMQLVSQFLLCHASLFTPFSKCFAQGHFGFDDFHVCIIQPKQF
jgi:hypothetical protein